MITNRKSASLSIIKSKMRQLIYITYFFLFLFTNRLSSQQRTLVFTQGGGPENFTAASISEAGADLSSFIETNANFVEIWVRTRGNTGNTANRNYAVTVRRQDINWHPSLDFYVRRTGNGNGAATSTITGGTSYLLLSTFDQVFFTGFRRRLDVPIQYRIEGISLTIPSGNYSTNIIYTVTDP